MRLTKTGLADASTRRDVAQRRRVGTTVTKRMKEKSRLTKEEWREYTKTVWHIANVTHPEHPAVFPPEIPKRLIKLFSFIGETVLDPFAGVGSTADAAVALDRRAICIDQNEGYVRHMRSKWETDLWKRTEVDIRCADCRNLNFLDDDSIGLVVTSPPYWNKAAYGGGLTNLGSIASYSAFLESLKPAFAECYRVLIPGRKIAVVTANVNQHTDYGLLTFPLAADFAALLRDIGFLMINELIWSKDGTGGKWGSWGRQRPIFGSYPYPPNFLFKNIHEYILIFAKPAERRTKGPKVVRLSDIMTNWNMRPTNGTQNGDSSGIPHPLGHKTNGTPKLKH